MTHHKMGVASRNGLIILGIALLLFGIFITTDTADFIWMFILGTAAILLGIYLHYHLHTDDRAEQIHRKHLPEHHKKRPLKKQRRTKK